MATIKLRRGSKSTWSSANPVLNLAEPGLETDTGRIKYGDGSTAWNSLPYFGRVMQRKTADYTLLATDLGCNMSCSGGARTITLPPVANVSGLWFPVTKIDSSANALTIDGNASETINGALTYTITVQWECRTFLSDGTEWVVI